jgi:hypothetical protein
MHLRAAAAVAMLSTLAAGAPALAADPPLTVPKATLDAALHCHGTLQDARRHPYAPGLDDQAANAAVGASLGVIGNHLSNQVPKVRAEPPVRAYALRAATMRLGIPARRG